MSPLSSECDWRFIIARNNEARCWSGTSGSLSLCDGVSRFRHLEPSPHCLFILSWNQGSFLYLSILFNLVSTWWRFGFDLTIFSLFDSVVCVLSQGEASGSVFFVDSSSNQFIRARSSNYEVQILLFVSFLHFMLSSNSTRWSLRISVVYLNTHLWNFDFKFI